MAKTPNRNLELPGPINELIDNELGPGRRRTITRGVSVALYWFLRNMDSSAQSQAEDLYDRWLVDAEKSGSALGADLAIGLNDALGQDAPKKVRGKKAAK